jgi:hypothetical protein
MITFSLRVYVSPHDNCFAYVFVAELKAFTEPLPTNGRLFWPQYSDFQE